MILEETSGNVKVVLNGKTLAIGDNIDNSQYALVAVIGTGQATFRDSPSTTLTLTGVKVEEAPAPAPTPAPVVKAATKPAPQPEPTPEAPTAE